MSGLRSQVSGSGFWLFGGLATKDGGTFEDVEFFS